MWIRNMQIFQRVGFIGKKANWAAGFLHLCARRSTGSPGLGGGPDAPRAAGKQQPHPQKDERPTAAGPACVFISNGIQYFF